MTGVEFAWRQLARVVGSVRAIGRCEMIGRSLHTALIALLVFGSADAFVALVTSPLAARAPKPVEPERPQLSLVGTLASEGKAVGVFVEMSTKNVIRLKPGQNHNGWVLRSIRGREATLEKDSETTVLALP
jgi:hypothetical protein